MRKILIGLAGCKRCGKDTVADWLVRDHGFVKYAIAGPLKETCKLLFELTDDQLHGDAKDVVDERYGVTPRYLMQRLGTEFVRDTVGQSFWIDRFRRWYESTDATRIVVSDVRFPNEVATIESLGGYVFGLYRPSTDDESETETHASEKPENLRVHGVVINDSSIDQLIERVTSSLRNRNIL